MKTSIPRLRSVKFKDGAEIRVLHNDMPRQTMARLVSDVGLIQSYPAGRAAVGYALVVWGHDGTTASICRIYDARRVSRMQAPRFVRDALTDDNIRTNVAEDLVER